MRPYNYLQLRKYLLKLTTTEKDIPRENTFQIPIECYIWPLNVVIFWDDDGCQFSKREGGFINYPKGQLDIKFGNFITSVNTIQLYPFINIGVWGRVSPLFVVLRYLFCRLARDAKWSRNVSTRVDRVQSGPDWAIATRHSTKTIWNSNVKNLVKYAEYISVGESNTS